MSMAMKKSTNGYSKLDKEDPEDIIRRRAQFLIYKALKQADYKRKPSFLRIRLCRLKIKIGKKFKKTMSSAKTGVCKQFLNEWKRLFGNAGINAIASLPNSVLA